MELNLMDVLHFVRRVERSRRVQAGSAEDRWESADGSAGTGHEIDAIDTDCRRLADWRSARHRAWSGPVWRRLIGQPIERADGDRPDDAVNGPGEDRLEGLD